MLSFAYEVRNIKSCKKEAQNWALHSIDTCQSVYVFMCLNHHDVAEFQIYNLSSVISGMIVTVKSLLDLLKVQESM